MLPYVSTPQPPRPPWTRSRTHRKALDAALRKAAILDRLDPRGDAYGAAGQALEDFVKREDQIVARGEDVSGWISTVTERRWINELRYQGRRGYDRLDAPVSATTSTTLGDLTAARGLDLADVIELRERLRGIAGEQRAALEHLRTAGVQARHLRVVELALTSDLLHQDIASAVNREFARSHAQGIADNTVTQILSRQRDRLAAHGAFPTVVRRLRRTRSAA
jgi:DNA-directed RNA polymerase specialized sigma24 family protein